MPNYTDKGLPIVNGQTIDSFVGRYRHRGGDLVTHLEEVRKRMIKENPYLVRHMEMRVEELSDGISNIQRKEVYNLIFHIVTEIYGLLELQGEANRMEDRLR